MLLVQVRVDRSAIHGLGVFAVEAIAKGTQIWRFTPGFDLDIDPDVIANQPSPFREYLLHYGYVDSRLQRYILCCDDARFLNHSNAPNVFSDYELDRYGVDIAARGIAAGEELTVDYEAIEGRSPNHG